LEKHSVSRLSNLFAHLHLLSSDSFSSTLLSSNLSLLSASALLCFSSAHMVGSLTSKLPSMTVGFTKNVQAETFGAVYIGINIGWWNSTNGWPRKLVGISPTAGSCQHHNILEGWWIGNSLRTLDGQENKMGRKGTHPRPTSSIFWESKLCSEWIFIPPKKNMLVKKNALQVPLVHHHVPYKKLHCDVYIYICISMKAWLAGSAKT